MRRVCDKEQDKVLVHSAAGLQASPWGDPRPSGQGLEDNSLWREGQGQEHGFILYSPSPSLAFLAGQGSEGPIHIILPKTS